jgi:hypothetical protein
MKNEPETPPPLEFAEARDEDAKDCLCSSRFPRIGNLHVLWEAPHRPDKRRQLYCVCGPYWRVMLCCTTPMVALPSGAVLFCFAPHVPLWLALLTAATTLAVLVSLWKTSSTDPGLVVRRSENPAAPYDVEAAHGDANLAQPRAPKEWSWEDRTQSWRPRTAKFSRDCGVLVDEYDHTCPMVKK